MTFSEVALGKVIKENDIHGDLIPVRKGIVVSSLADMILYGIELRDYFRDTHLRGDQYCIDVWYLSPENLIFTNLSLPSKEYPLNHIINEANKGKLDFFGLSVTTNKYEETLLRKCLQELSADWYNQTHENMQSEETIVREAA